MGGVTDLHPSVPAFGGDAADAYDAGRAGFPSAVVESLGLPPAARVLDVGAGTGLLSVALLAAGHDVVAVEPLAGMRARLLDKIGRDRVLAGAAEALPLDDGSVDAVTAGDAFHWFDADRAAAEIHRVLRPDGTCTLVWRWTDWPDVPGWYQGVRDRITALRGDHPGFRGEQGREGFARHGGFAPFEHRRIPFVKPGSRAGVLANLRSISFIAALPGEQRASLLAEVDAELAAAGVTEFQEPHVADIWITHRR